MRPVLLALVVIALVPVSSAAAAKRYVAADCRHLAARPPTLILTCGDGGVQLFGLRWSSFGTVAHGTGILSVRGKRTAGVRVTLRSAKPCRDARGRLVYRTAVLSFPHGRPSGAPSRQTLGCPF
jgi:hypothetical protein